MRSQYEAKAFQTGQEDNIIRDGVLTTQQAYDMFLRAGMTTKEWLTKTYGQVKQPTNEEMELMEKTIYKAEDKTDYEERVKSASKMIDETKKEKEKLIEENKKLTEEYYKNVQKVEKTKEPTE
nr:MAG: hypothetical protein [Microvirus Sku114]